MIDYDKLQKALKHLEAQYANHLAARDRPELTEIDREGIAESVIQRFETCFDTLWKDLTRYMTEDMGLPDVPSGPKPIIKFAAKNNLFANNVDAWINYANARNSTAHDYSGEKAIQVIAVVGDFIDDAIGLYQTMTGTTWE